MQENRVDQVKSMKEIPLTQGKVALVDVEDYERINKYKWHYNSGYAVRQIRVEPSDGYKNRQKKLFMHRVILNIKVSYKYEEIDHINGNSIDNRKENLRAVEHKQNCQNRKIQSNNKSKYKGVHLQKDCKRYRADISVNSKQVYLGMYETAVQAAIVYNVAAIKYYGKYAKLNRYIKV